MAVDVHSATNWLQAQSEDAEIKNLQRKLHKKTGAPLIVLQHQLWCKQIPHPRDLKALQHRLVVPKSLRAKILEQYHDAPTAGHLGRNKTLTRLQAAFWWPTMTRDVRQYVRSCPQCQVHKDRPRKAIARKHTGGLAPMHRVAMDFFGPLPPTSSDNRYVFVLQDTFTKYTELYPLPRINASTVAECMLEHFVPRHGMPQEFLSDNGPPFTSSFLQTLLIALDGKQLFTPAHHPSSNGQVERMMQTLRQMLAIYTKGHDWDRWIRHLRWAYNTAYHPSISDTPFFLCHGRDPNGPMDILPPTESPSTDHVSYKSLVLDKLRRAFQVVKHHHTLPKESPKPTFAVGDAVLMRLDESHAALKHNDNAKKLRPRWSAPFRVTDVLSDSRYNIANHTKSFDNVHVSHLKHYFVRA